jgi:hypothetical protein
MTPFRVPRGGGTQIGRTRLSTKEPSRAEAMGRVKAGSLRLPEAAELLALSYPQAKRWARHRCCGGWGSAMKISVGRWPRNTWPSDNRGEVQAETLRRSMKQAGLWRGQRAAESLSATAVAEGTLWRVGAKERKSSWLAGRARSTGLSDAHGR